MDKDGFMRCLAGTKSMGQRRSLTVYLQLESVESVGHIERKAVKGTHRTWERETINKSYIIRRKNH
jgi:hypothetical protein